MSSDAISPDFRKQAQDRVETLARSLFQIRGLAAPGADQLGQIVHGAVASASPEELRAGGSISAATIGRIDQLIAGTVEAGRPRNVHSAEAAQLAKLDDRQAAGMLGFKAYAEFQRTRAEARAARENNDSGSSSASGDRYAALPAAGDRVSPAVMSAYLQSYAGAGLGRGTVQTFAEVGLQRGVYDAYRKEGFTREDIGDAAKTVKTLDWKHDRQAFDDIQRSTRPERAAIVEIHREKDAEKQKALIERKRRDLHIDEKPHDAQERWNRNIDRVQGKRLDAAHEHGRVAASNQSDRAVTAERAPEHGKPAAAKVRVAALTHGQAKTTTGAGAAADDDFGATVTPTVKMAGAKPAAPGPKAG